MKNPIYKYALLLGILMTIFMLIQILTFVGLYINTPIEAGLRFLLNMLMMALAINEFFFKRKSRLKFTYPIGISIGSITGFLGLLLFVFIIMNIRLIMDGRTPSIVNFIDLISRYGPMVLLASVISPLLFIFKKNKFTEEDRDDVLDFPIDK